MDKTLTKQLVRPAGVTTPDWHAYHGVSKEDIPRIMQENSVPCVVKTPTGGSTIGVYIVRRQEELEPALTDCLHYGSDLLAVH